MVFKVKLSDGQLVEFANDLQILKQKNREQMFVGELTILSNVRSIN